MNEEIRSTNEELETLNDELQRRTGALNDASAYLSWVLARLRVNRRGRATTCQVTVAPLRAVPGEIRGSVVLVDERDGAAAPFPAGDGAG